MFAKVVRLVTWPHNRWRWPLRILVGFTVFTLVSIEVTSRSPFCNSCHIMGSFYKSWQASSHFQVDCVKCHIPPGAGNLIHAKLNGLGQVVDDVLSRTSGKPSAQVPDISCTRAGCHNIDAVGKQTRREGKFFFDHGKHLDLSYQNIEIHCTTCHSHVQGSNHFEVNTNACVTCHLAYPKAPKAAEVTLVASTQPAAVVANTALATPEAARAHARKLPAATCNTCHNAPDKPIEYQGLKVLHSEYLSYGAACESCHRGVTAPVAKIQDDQCFSCHDFGMERLGSVEETHRVHSTGKKVECFSCHGVIRHGPSAQSMRLDQIDCQSCHTGQHAIQQSTYKSTRTLAHVPSTQPAVTPMFMAHVNCTACHVAPRPVKSRAESGATVAVATASACDSCHKPGLGAQMIPLWQRNTHALHDSVVQLIPVTSPTDDRGRQLVGEAKQLIDLVRLDGSWGVHNPRYTEELLGQARAKLVEARGPVTRPVSRAPSAAKGVAP
jgi:nitrate/TMAO reductase-like tetraheme cytochrome c subunit